MKKNLEDISERDFDTSAQYKISRTGAQKRFIVKDFSPKAFRNLRHLFNVSSEEYLVSNSNDAIDIVAILVKNQSETRKIQREKLLYVYIFRRQEVPTQNDNKS
jgi:hypothetical protein